MKTNYKVFLSSTHKVLTDEREVLTKSLLEINCIPIGTELKNCSSDSEISEFRNKLIEDSDIMIIFLGDWNGEEINHEEIINIESDYKYAKRIKKPIFLFIKNGFEQQKNKDRSLEYFLYKIKKDSIYSFFNNFSELSILVRNQVLNYIKNESEDIRFKKIKKRVIWIIAIMSAFITVAGYLLLDLSISNLIALIFTTLSVIILGIRFLDGTINSRKKSEESGASVYREYLKEKLYEEPKGKQFSREKVDKEAESNNTENSEKNIIASMLKNNDETTEYFSIGKGHAKFSFIFSIIACSLGIIFLIGSVLLAFLFKQLEPAIIAAVSGAITEVIAGTVLWVHNKSALQLNHYYDALHENERFLSAVNLVDKISKEQQDEVYKEIIRKQLELNNSECKSNNKES